MYKIATFEVDHTRLTPGVYLSRQDTLGNTVLTTLDVRIKKPYTEQPLSPAVLHTMEHVGAVYLRQQSAWKDRIVYWGPMGCQTGFDLLVAGTVDLSEAAEVIRKTFLFIAAFEGPIPGAQEPWQCGNYTLHDLPAAKLHARQFAQRMARWTPADSVYPHKTN